MSEVAATNGHQSATPIVAGDDGRSGGADAVALATLFAAPKEREVIVVTSDSGSAADDLISAGVAAGAGMIVIGSSHRSGLGRVMPGAVAQRVPRGAPCPLAIAPEGFARSFVNGLNLIGVAYDGSDESRHALAAAVSLAESFSAAIRLISVFDDPQLAGADWAGVAPVAPVDEEERDRLRERMERELSQALETIPPAISSIGETISGRPAERLAEGTDGLDLLVMGSRGYGPLKRVVVGSVSGPVSRSAKCPVLITAGAVRAGDVEKERMPRASFWRRRGSSVGGHGFVSR